MRLNKKAEGEVGFETVGKYLLWAAVAVVCTIGIYFLIKTLST
jgi:hypothetical protein